MNFKTFPDYLVDITPSNIDINASLYILDERNSKTWCPPLIVNTECNELMDFNNDNHINLKSPEDAYASAANYLNNIGWKKNIPCFYRIELKQSVPKKFLNVSAQKIKNKRKLKFFQKYIKKNVILNRLDQNLKVGIVTPDKDIIPGAETLSPAFVIFENYERILQWNRSLRFALAVCTLKDKLNNDL